MGATGLDGSVSLGMMPGLWSKRIRFRVAKSVECTEEDLFQSYYNFIRPPSELTFGSEVRTPAKQAGLIGRDLRFSGYLLC